MAKDKRLYNVWLEMDSVSDKNDSDAQLIKRFRLSMFVTREQAEKVYEEAALTADLRPKKRRRG